MSVYTFNAATKSIALNDLPESAWRFVLGSANEDGNDIGALYKAVPWLYRAVRLRAHAVASMPFEVLRGETEMTVKQLPYLKGFGGLLDRAEASKSIFGAAYWFREYNSARTLRFRYLAPASIRPLMNDSTGLTGFERKLRSQSVKLELTDILYFWEADPDKEIGPGVGPAMVALEAAGMIRNADRYGAEFFRKGAIMPLLLSVEGNPARAELDKLERWWKQLLGGVKKAWETVAFPGTVKPTIIGSPLKDLALPELTQTKRQDIATALGIPPAILFSEAATFATAQQDDLNFYTKTIIPECQVFEEALNDQFFAAQGLEFHFRPDKLETFQALEAEKADRIVALFQAGILSRNEAREQMDLPPLAEVLPPPAVDVIDVTPEPLALPEPTKALGDGWVVTADSIEDILRERLALVGAEDAS